MAEAEVQNKEENALSSAAGNIKMIIAGIVIIILAAGISFAVAKFATNSTNRLPTTVEKGSGKKASLGTTFDAGEYITNLADGGRFIKIRVVIAFDSQEEVELEVTDKLPVIQHTINKVLRGETSDSLSQPKAMEKLADKLKKSINELLVNGSINDVYFTYFVVQ